MIYDQVQCTRTGERKKNDAKKKKEKRRETATVWRSYARYADPDYSTTPVNKT